MKQLLAAAGMVALASIGLPAPPPHRPAIPQLILRLGAEHFADREVAMAALEAAGPDAFPALEAATRDPNPEIARRAHRVLAKLRNADISRLLLVPKPVRLAYHRVPLLLAVEDLRTQTGIPLQLDIENVADPLRPVTCETDELPAWEAVDTLCRAGGLREVFADKLDVPRVEIRRNRSYYSPPPPPPGADAVPIALADGASTRLPGTRSMSVRVLALPASFPGHQVTLGTGAVLFHLDVTPLPGLHWLEVAGVRVTKVIDAAGRYGRAGGLRETPDSVERSRRTLMFGPKGLAGVPGGLGWDGGLMLAPTTHPNPRIVPVPLQLATPSARSLKRLEGVVFGEVLALNQPLVTVENPTGNVGITFAGTDGFRVTVLSIRDGEEGKGTVVRLRTESPSPGARQRQQNPWGPLWPERITPDAGRYFRLYGANGVPISYGLAVSDELTDDGTTRLTVDELLIPHGAAAPFQLVLMGSKTVLVEIPFTLENVSLP